MSIKLKKFQSLFDMRGGSIIASNLVVSEAHCFWKKGILSNNISIIDRLYKVAAGKYYRNLTIIYDF